MKNRITEGPGDKLFMLFVKIIAIFAILITLYPIIYVLSMSISDRAAVTSGQVWLWPVGFSLDSYKLVFSNPDVLRSYYNTIWYTVVGTVINVFANMYTGYLLARRTFFLRNFLAVLLTVPMYFGAGLIPFFLLMRTLHLYNTRWVIVIPGAISLFTAIMAREYYHTIPDSLRESAMIDGAGELKIWRKIYLPLSKPIMATFTVFAAVSFWNSYLGALLYIQDKNLHPIQVYLVNIIIRMSDEMLKSIPGVLEREYLGTQLKYAIIIITVLPILCVYPFLQKYFVQGARIGAIKE